MFHSDTEQQEQWNTTIRNVPVSNSANLNPPESCEKPKFSKQLGGLADVTFPDSIQHIGINAAMFPYHMPQVEKRNTTVRWTPCNPT